LFENKVENITRSLKEIYSIIRGNDVAGRGTVVLPEDIWVVSYPKSGNTWTRFLIANLMFPDESVSFLNIERLIPDIYVSPNSLLLSAQSPRILKSHEYFDPRYQRTIYIVRDPRDVLLSYYHHQLKFKLIPEGYSLHSFALSFIDGKLDPFGSWGENVGSWMGARQDDKQFLLLRYEDLLDSTESNLARVAQFMGRSIHERALAVAVEKSSADRMRKLEKAEATQWRATRKTRLDKPFVRSATSGGWQSQLPDDIASMVAEKWERQMTEATT